MTVLTSAKSKFTKPGEVIKSEIPCTPWRNTSSATCKASFIGVFLSTISNNRLLAIMTKVSTFCFNSSIPLSANCARLGPSNIKGRVTTPTVKAPDSLATRAIIGAAPVPVPPPIPAVIKIISESLSKSAMTSSLSSAAF